MILMIMTMFLKSLNFQEVSFYNIVNLCQREPYDIQQYLSIDKASLGCIFPDVTVAQGLHPSDQ